MKTLDDVARYFQDDHPHVLDEETYKEMMAVINPNDLPHRDFAPLIPYVHYIATRHDIMKFLVPGKVGNEWPNYIQFVEWDDQVRDRSLSAPEAARLLLWGGNLRLHCTCPAFVFWGYEYVLTQLGAAIFPETRYPTIRNPQLKGLTCKHGRRVLKTLGFHLGDMAQAIKLQRQHLG